MVLAVRLYARRLSHSAHAVALDGHPSSRLECSGRKRSMVLRSNGPRLLLLQKACGHERPVVDLPDDLLLPGVALHVVLSARVGLGCGLALGGGVAVTFPGERCPPEPVTEDPVLHQLGAVEPENMWGYIHLNNRLAN